MPLNELVLAHLDRLFIGGEWAAPATNAKLSVYSPSTEEKFAEAAEACDADIDRAVAAARAAFDHGPWPRLSVAERAEAMSRFAKCLQQRAEEMAAIWAHEGGAPLSFAGPASGLAGVMIEANANLALKYPFEEVRQSYAGAAVVRREPVGVVAAILPWNAPPPLTAMKLGPALAAGCTVVVKTAPETPLYGYVYAACAEAAGLPKGVLNIVAAGRQASDRLVRHAGVDKVSFTGSVVTGKHVAAVCAERLARCSLELGGKSAAIVLEDSDVAATAASLAQHATTHAGQVCYALTRILAPRNRHDEYAEAIADCLRKARIGDPLDPETEMGPLAMKRQLDRVEGYVASGRAEGAVLAIGGARPKGLNRGHYFEPTLFTHVDNRMKIAQEEIFGPVLCLIPYDDEDQAVSIANDSSFGLHGAVYTRNAARAYELSKRVRTGNFGMNGAPVDPIIAPFGGFKQSGLGREGGPEGLHGFTELKTVYMPEAPAHLKGGA